MGPGFDGDATCNVGTEGNCGRVEGTVERERGCGIGGAALIRATYDTGTSGIFVCLEWLDRALRSWSRNHDLGTIPGRVRASGSLVSLARSARRCPEAVARSAPIE